MFYKKTFLIFKNSDGELWCQCGNRIHTYGFFHFHNSPSKAGIINCDGFCEKNFWRCDLCKATVEYENAPIEDEPDPDQSPRQLPVIRLGRKLYYRDDRLREYRNVNNPHDRLPFLED